MFDSWCDTEGSSKGKKPAKGKGKGKKKAGSGGKLARANSSIVDFYTEFAGLAGGTFSSEVDSLEGRDDFMAMVALHCCSPGVSSRNRGGDEGRA